MLSYLLAIHTLLCSDYYLPPSFLIFISSLYLILIYLIYFTHGFSIFFVISYYLTLSTSPSFTISFNQGSCFIC